MTTAFQRLDAMPPDTALRVCVTDVGVCLEISECDAGGAVIAVVKMLHLSPERAGALGRDLVDAASKAMN